MFLGFCHLSSLFFFSLQSFHNVLCLFIFIYHNITNTQISHNNCSQTQHILWIFRYDWFIVSNCFIISLKDKKDVSHIEFPCFMISTKFGTLSEKFLNNSVVLFIPINFSLRHQHRNILLKAVIKLFKRLFNTLIIFSQSGILNGFC